MRGLDERQRRHLRGLAHHLDPVARIGQDGLTTNVVREVEAQLLAHELIKVKVAASDRDARESLIEQLCRDTDALLVQRIGNMAVVYRRHPRKPRIVLPD